MTGHLTSLTGDVCITLFHMPHSGTRNENGSESRKNIIFRIRNKSRQPNHKVNGVSDHPDRGQMGEWLEYEEGNNPWERSKHHLCNMWDEGAIDIVPGLLGACGVGAPEGFQGRDISPIWRGEESPAEPNHTPRANESVYLMNMGPGWPDREEWVGRWRGVRTERYTYARWYNNERYGKWSAS